MQPSAKQAVVKALAAHSDATSADIASAACLARSTAGKVLAQLESAGNVRRVPGGRDGARRLPDRFALSKVRAQGKRANVRASKPTEPPGTGTDRKPCAEPTKKAPKGAARTRKHSKPGQLDGSRPKGASRHPRTVQPRAVRISVLPLEGPDARRLRDRQLAVIVRLLRRATAEGRQSAAVPARRQLRTKR
jgi:hypothetical protein